MARGCVVQRNGGWKAIWDEPREGRKRQQRTKSGFRTRREAEEFLAEQVSKISRDRYIPPTKLTLETFLREHWLPTLDVRASTRDNDERNIARHIVPALGAVQLQKLRADRLSRCYRELAANGNRHGGRLNAKTIHNIHSTLHRALKAARKWGYIETSPADDADLPKYRRPKMKVWSPQQLRAFLKSVKGDRLYAAWLLVITTGMRRGELLGLRWEDIDLATGQVHIRQTRIVINNAVVLSEPKTESGERELWLDAATLAALRTHRARQGREKLLVGPRWVDSGLVFTRPDGQGIHPQRFSAWFQQRTRAAGLPPIRLHDVRHSYATAGLLAGIDNKIMSERLGHADPYFTAKTYQKVLKEMDQAAAETVAAVILG
jgi:integrase